MTLTTVGYDYNPETFLGKLIGPFLILELDFSSYISHTNVIDCFCLIRKNHRGILCSFRCICSYSPHSDSCEQVQTAQLSIKRYWLAVFSSVWVLLLIDAKVSLFSSHNICFCFTLLLHFTFSFATYYKNRMWRNEVKLWFSTINTNGGEWSIVLHLKWRSGEFALHEPWAGVCEEVFKRLWIFGWWWWWKLRSSDIDNQKSRWTWGSVRERASRPPSCGRCRSCSCSRRWPTPASRWYTWPW